MKKVSFAVCAVAVVAAAITGCAKNRIVGPTEYPVADGAYIIASYSKAPSQEKVKMIQKANSFCKEQGMKTEFIEMHVQNRSTDSRTAVAVTETIVFGRGATNLEIIFRCKK